MSSKKDLAMKIASYIDQLEYELIDEKTREEIKKRILDSIGVAIAAYNAPPVKAARSIARRAAPASGSSGSYIWGDGVKTIPSYAALANGIAVRYLDFNDTYLSKEAMHPSDMIPALIAVGEDYGLNGKDLIMGIAVAYEIAARLGDAFSVRSIGVDHVTYIAIGTAAGISKLLDLPIEKTYNAINLAVNESVSLRQTRAGTLSMWKGSTAAFSSMKGLVLSLLASEGVTGPSPVFEGEFGFFNVISKTSFDIENFGGVKNEEFRVLRTSIKNWPVEYHAMSAVEAALKLREKIKSLSEIELIEIETFTVSYKIIVKDPDKWDPKTRETADHSLPYIVARALIDGYIWIDSFSDEKVLADDVRSIMGKMKVMINSQFDEIYPEGIPNRIRIYVREGEMYEETVTYPKGHFRNPMKREDVEQKFYRCVGDAIDENDAKEITRIIWNLETLDSISKLTELLRIRK